MARIIEREVKYHVTDPLTVIEKLKFHNAVFVGFHFEKTVRVDKPNWELSNSGTFIRLRSGFKNTLTLKKARNEDSEVSERLELEIEIDDIDSCLKLLKEIGLHESLIMEKYRMIWEINGTIITLDELPFGTYVEIEGTIQSIKIISQILGFNYEERIIVTYWELYENILESSALKDCNPNILFPVDYVSKLLAK